MITHVAIRFKDIIWSLPKPNRHHHIIHLITSTTTHKYVDAHGDDQGFLDDKGNYLTREEALQVAIDNNQLKPGGLALKLGELYSEDLW